MALFPRSFRNFWDNYFDSAVLRPSHLLERHFGDGLFPDDLLTALDEAPRRRGFKRSWRSVDEELATVKEDKDGFRVSVDVQQFTPDEVSVKMQENWIMIEGKHEEKRDEHGFVSRHFVRKYFLPEGHDASKVASTLSSDGVLTITAPRLGLPEPEKERTIPIIHTGKEAITEKDDEKDKHLKENPAKRQNAKL